VEKRKVSGICLQKKWEPRHTVKTCGERIPMQMTRDLYFLFQKINGFDMLHEIYHSDLHVSGFIMRTQNCREVTSPFWFDKIVQLSDVDVGLSRSRDG
jgi:hypothetical protein